MRTILLAAFFTCTSLSAQCANAWQSIGTVPGIDGQLSAATMWDPDGPGPATAKLVVAGSFTTAGGVPASNVAAWDPATGVWSSLGSGIGGGVSAYASAVLALPNGDLVVGGNFTVANGAVADLVARWNGTSWIAMGSLNAGPSGAPFVAALTPLPNGDIVAGGSFTNAGATPVSRVARWNGTAWLPLATGLDSRVYALTTLPNGDVVAGGEFSAAGSVAAPRVARWNGTAWSAMGPAQANGNSVNALATMPNGDVVASGVFASLGGVTAYGVARWNGTAWSPLGGTISDTIGAASLLALPNGDVILGGYVQLVGGVQVNGIARWNGTAWSALSSGVGGSSGSAVFALARLANGDLIAGGRFESAGGVAASRIARWNGTAWSSMAGGSAPGDTVSALLAMPDGSVVAAGRFLTAGGFVANHVARWNAGAWSPLGGGLPLQVDALLLEPNGSLVAGGYGSVKRWNGTAWTAVGAAFDTEVEALGRLPNGDLVAGGNFLHIGGSFVTGLARWNGTAWTAFGGGSGGTVHSLVVLGNGDVVVGGWLNPPGAPQAHGIARWDGASWSTFGSGLEGSSTSAAYAIEVLPSGALVAGGVFSLAGGVAANNIAMWNGVAWSPLGTGMNGPVTALKQLPNGDLLAGGLFTQAGGIAANRIARWNGTTWSPVGAGLVLSPFSTNPPYNGVRAFAMAANGELFVGGGIFAAGGQPSANLARLTTTCPATSQSQGAGCAGDTVTSTLPWVGSTWRADASGLPSAAMVFVVNGFGATSLPLTAVFTTAQPGCTLHVQPDFVDLILGSQGTASVQFVLPNTPSLAGVTFRHQMVPLALDGTLAVTATNSLQLTVGAF